MAHGDHRSGDRNLLEDHRGAVRGAGRQADERPHEDHAAARRDRRQHLQASRGGRRRAGGDGQLAADFPRHGRPHQRHDRIVSHRSRHGLLSCLAVSRGRSGTLGAAPPGHHGDARDHRRQRTIGVVRPQPCTGTHHSRSERLEVPDTGQLGRGGQGEVRRRAHHGPGIRDLRHAREEGNRSRRVLDARRELRPWLS